MNSATDIRVELLQLALNGGQTRQGVTEAVPPPPRTFVGILGGLEAGPVGLIDRNDLRAGMDVDVDVRLSGQLDELGQSLNDLFAFRVERGSLLHKQGDLVRELGITVMRFFLLRYVVLPASRGGKLKTVLQSVALSLYLLPLDHLPAFVGVVAAEMPVRYDFEALKAQAVAAKCFAAKFIAAPQVVTAKLGNDAGIIGAGMLCK